MSNQIIDPEQKHGIRDRPQHPLVNLNFNNIVKYFE